MAIIEETAHIRAPVQEVFEQIAHPEWNKDWIPDVVESEKLTEGPNRPGSRFRFVTRAPLGLHVSAEAEITAMDPPHLLEFRGTRGLAHQGRWELEPRADGTTRVRFRIEFELTGIESAILRAVGLRQFLVRHVRGSVRGLRGVVENGRYAPGGQAGKVPPSAAGPADPGAGPP